MWERWDSNPLHGRLAHAGQVMQATVAPLAPIAVGGKWCVQAS